MIYRLAKEDDLEEVCRLIQAAVAEMEENHIFQWDELYPVREDFLEDIRKGQLWLGMEEEEIAVIYVINRECDEEYQKAAWRLPDCDYRVLHRFCVHPAYQHRKIAGQTLAHLEEELRGEGVRAVRLDVFSENPYALALYRRGGYEQIGVADWRKGRFFLMEKLL